MIRVRAQRLWGFRDANPDRGTFPENLCGVGVKGNGVQRLTDKRADCANGRLPNQMTIIEKILELKQSNQPFWIHLDNGREVEVRGGDWISVNPSGDNSHVTVYGPEDDEESWIPLCFNYQSLGQRNRTVTDSGIQISVARVT